MVKLIKASCDTSLPFCVHYGFLINDVVVHNTPGMKNEFGGNIVTQKYEDFKKERKIYDVLNVNVKPQKVFNYAKRHESKKFNALTYNCQQFANDVITGVKYSSILSRAVLFLIVGTIVYKIK
jgi:hypothetical protein